MFMMTSQILKFVDFSKTQKSKYLESGALFFLQITKDHLLHIKVYFVAKNSFLAEVNFNLVYHSLAPNLALSKFCSLPDCLNTICVFLVKLVYRGFMYVKSSSCLIYNSNFVKFGRYLISRFRGS